MHFRWILKLLNSGAGNKLREASYRLKKRAGAKKKKKAKQSCGWTQFFFWLDMPLTAPYNTMLGWIQLQVMLLTQILDWCYRDIDHSIRCSLDILWLVNNMGDYSWFSDLGDSSNL